MADGWWLSRVPDVDSALVSINPQSGAIVALVDGFDFDQSKFDHATQMLRQVDSNTKPFLYTTAMDKSLTLASMLNGVPISRWDAGAGSDQRPRNPPPRYTDPIRLRQELRQPKNVVMVCAMHAMGVDYAAEYLQRFGFSVQGIVHIESLALGSISFTPLQVARGYSVVTNDGFLINPFFISKTENDQDGILFEERPKIACPQYDLPVIHGDTPKSNMLKNKDIEDAATSTEPQNDDVSPQPQPEQANQSLVAQSGAQKYVPYVINTPPSFLIKSALNSNIFDEPSWMGTGWRVGRDLQRHDTGRKTGTTNSSKDAWFSGYSPGVVTSVWIGFGDHRRDLGRTTASGAIKDQVPGYEGGAKSAQPVWDSFMKSVSEGVPEGPLTPLPGTVTMNIDRNTGQLANGGDSRAEYFIGGTQPTQQAVHEVGTTLTDGGGETRELF